MDIQSIKTANNYTATLTCRVVVLVSGTGRNLQALIDQANDYEIVAVISNKADAYALERAQNANITTNVLSYSGFNSREDYDAELIKRIDAHQPDLVLLAGFMRILSDEFVNHFHGRLLNIHPSLLPKFKGLHTHQHALDEHETEHGCTVHFVEPELDSGPLVLQGKVLVNANDNAATLAERVMGQEQRIYPLAAHWFATGRLRLENGQPTLDNQPLIQPVILPNENT